MLTPCRSLLRSAAVVFTTSRSIIKCNSRSFHVPPAAFSSVYFAGYVPSHRHHRHLLRSDAVTQLRQSSSFQAPEPPVSKGQAVYQDIDLDSHASSHSRQRNADPNAVFVVTGASRGIGLQLVKTLASRTKGKIVACCRSPDDDESALSKYLASCDDGTRRRIETVQLDVTSQKSIEKVAEIIEGSCGGRVDMLLNVAGVLGDGSSTPGPERSMRALDREWMELSLQTNCIGPIMLAKHLAPLMTQRRRGSTKKDDDTDRPPISIIANWSARVGSISDNNLGGWYSYRLSKAALNQATRTMSHELKRQSVWTVALHPGTTDSDLSKPFQKNVAKERLFPVDFTVDQLLSVLDHMEESHSGGLYDWAGKAIPF